ncbi:SDR family oxidoreductase [Streptomyces sp. NPDC002405]
MEAGVVPGDPGRRFRAVRARVLQGRADASGRSQADVTADALSIQSLKHFTDPDDIAALALFLASDSAKSITGQTVPIDGGSKAAQ